MKILALSLAASASASSLSVVSGLSGCAAPLTTTSSTTRSSSTATTRTTLSNRRIVEDAFVRWKERRGSFYDLLTDDATVTIAGQSPHSGTFAKATFLHDVARPFTARFSTPLLPTTWRVWSVDDEVIVRWESQATARDGRSYTNKYAYFLTMKEGRGVALTMFLDMAAFDDVWNRCQPVFANEGQAR